MPKTATPKTWPANETELLAALKTWLAGRGSGIYEEIELIKGEAVADVVAQSNRNGKPEAHVFEGKTSMEATLLRQAEWWTQYADGVWIVLPKPKGRTPAVLNRNIEKRAKFWSLLHKIGVGLIEIHRTEAGEIKVAVVIQAAQGTPGRGAQLLSKLNPDYQGTAAAGSPGGSKSSKWSLMRQRLVEAATARPGTPLKYLVKDFDHGYESDQKARTAIAGQYKKYGIPGIKIKGQELNVHPQ